jgi:signal transduction histidine kinase
MTGAAFLDPDEPGWTRPAPTPGERRADLILAAALFVGSILSLMLYTVAGFYDDPADLGVSILALAFITLPLAWRRVRPATVALVLSAAFIVIGQLHVSELLFTNITLFLALYSVGAWMSDRRRAFIVRIVIVFAMLVWLLISMFLATTDPDAMPGFSRAGLFSPLVAYLLIQILTNILYFGAAWFFGNRAWDGAKERAVLEQRTALLDRERIRSARQAVSLERLRIARELHDVVAHHVSVMGVQAGAARTVLDLDPAAARAALGVVEDNARSAIDELRGILGTLREPDAEAESAAETESEAASTVNVDRLPELCEASSQSGVPTRFETIGEPRPLPKLVSLTVYRVVQEGLTNARKYGGPDTRADVRLRYLDDAVEIEITNSGSLAVASPSRRRGSRTGTGLGHVGMQERVRATGGTLELGPRPRGGYLVRARIPVSLDDRLTGPNDSHERMVSA